MFLYLSFLRPPPTYVCVSQHQGKNSGIPFSLQISDDLRTEFPDLILDIFYTWLPLGATTAAATVPLQKLTTYHGSASRFKELRAPLPPAALLRNGGTSPASQQWTLALSWSPRPDLLDIPLVNDDEDSHSDLDHSFSHPFPVLSMPIRFGNVTKSHGKGPVEKQEEVVRAYQLPTPGPGFRETRSIRLALVERTSFDLDKKIWDSGIGLSSWLATQFRQHRLRTVAQNHNQKANTVNEGQRPRHVLTYANQDHVPSKGHLPLVDLLFDRLASKSRPLKIIELGTGIGLVSIVLSVLRSSAFTTTVNDVDNNTEEEELLDAVRCNDTILATDLSSAMPLLTGNIQSQDPHQRKQQPSMASGGKDTNPRSGINTIVPPKPMVLDWTEPIPEEVLAHGPFDIIVMADVTYNTDSFPSLINTISTLTTTDRWMNRPTVKDDENHTDEHQGDDINDNDNDNTQAPLILLGYKERHPDERILWSMLADDTCGGGIECSQVGQVSGVGGNPVEIWIGTQKKKTTEQEGKQTKA